MRTRPTPEGPPAVTAYIAVGSNIEPRRNLLAALRLLRRCGQVRVTGVSTVYRSAALGRPEQPDYLNGVWRIETALPPRRLRQEVLRPIEDQLGRRRKADRFAARPIDLDLVLYGQLASDEPDLKLPARDIDRPFVALPLLQLDPGLTWPGADAKLADRLAGVDVTALTAEPDITRELKESLKDE